MKLGKLERWYVNGPIRSYLHQPWVFGQFAKHATLHENCDALELGCGRGNGLALIQKNLKPHSLVGLDFDPEQIARAQKRFSKSDNIPIIRQGDAAALPYGDKAFHAIFSFGVVHHVPDWKRSIKECHRVLKAGGYLLMEEFYRPLLEKNLMNKMIPHPSERFTHQELLTEMKHLGFDITYEKELITNSYGLIIAQKNNTES